MSEVSANVAGKLAQPVVRTIRLKVRPECYSWLGAAAVEVNRVFNFCNETSFLAATRTDKKRKWLAGFDLCNLTAGACAYFQRIGADTIQQVCVGYAERRRAARRYKLRWRVSCGARRSLGWVPFKSASLRRRGRALRFCGKTFRVFEQKRLEHVRWKQGCFAQDSVGDWWLCLTVEIERREHVAPRAAVGIDLGVKNVAVTSDGERLDAIRFYRDAQWRLKALQRRGHRRQAQRLHRKIRRRRLNACHQFTRHIVNTYQDIVVGDVSSTKLVRTHLAKAVLDSGWGMIKRMLQYKGDHAGRSVQIINERNTTRVCSSCGALTGPGGPRHLAVRQWKCADCGESHDRDVNAARNILAVGSRCWASVCGNEPPLRSSPAREPSVPRIETNATAGAVRAPG